MIDRDRVKWVYCERKMYIASHGETKHYVLDTALAGSAWQIGIRSQQEEGGGGGQEQAGTVKAPRGILIYIPWSKLQSESSRDIPPGIAYNEGRAK